MGQLAGRIWKESMRKQRTQNAANQPMMIWRKPKQRVWPIKSALASLSRATIARENIAPTFPRMLSGGDFQTGSHTVCGRTDWMIALVLRAHQVTSQVMHLVYQVILPVTYQARNLAMYQVSYQARHRPMYPLLFLSSNQLIDRLMYPGLAGRTRKDTWIHIRSSTAPPNSGLMWRKPKQHAWLIRRVLASTSLKISAEENIVKPRKTSAGYTIATGSHLISGHTDWMTAPVLLPTVDV